MKRPSGIQFLTAFVLFLGLASIFGALLWQSNVIDRQGAAIRARDATIATLLQKYNDLYAEAQDQGVNPVAPTPDELQNSVPQAEQGPQGPQGPQGNSGRPPTDSEVQSAVDAYCGANICAITGPPGLNGSNGKDGLSGSNGLDGAQGSVGPKGDPGTNGTNGTNGVDGAPGPQGPQGEQGPKGDPGISCPDGTTLTSQQVLTLENPAGVTAFLCIGG